MSGYVKRIAAVKQIKEGFSTSGAPLSGLVKVEKYGGLLAVECSLLNFAPLSDGKYTCAVTDGNIVEIFDCPSGERASAFNLSNGFAAVICFVKGGVQAIASAVSGGMGYSLISLKSAVETVEQKEEKTNPEENSADMEYHDEAIAEVNYYELEGSENGGDDIPPEKEEADGSAGKKDENAGGAGGKQPQFFQKIEKEVTRLLSEYPKENGLCSAVENSDWVKIDYGDGKYYVFGVIYEDGIAQYLCFGVPAEGEKPPESLKNLAIHIPTDGGGYFVTSQSAKTGKAVKMK